MNARDLVTAVDLIDMVVDTAIELEVDVMHLGATMTFGNVGPDVTVVIPDRAAAGRLAKHLRLTASPCPSGTDLYVSTPSPAGRIVLTTTTPAGAR